MSSLSQAPRLEGLSPSHGAFQEHAAHPAKWSAELSSKGSWDACTSHGVSTFLHCAFTAHGLLEIAITTRAMQLAPQPTAGMPIGTEIAQPHPTPIGTVGLRAAMRRRVHLARAATRGDDVGWWSAGRLGVRHSCLRTGLAAGLVGEARKGLWDPRALTGWWYELGWPRDACGVTTGPGSMQHAAQPEQTQQHQLGEKEV